jgi:BASS family bile acid:Na+ symporter
MTLAKLLPLLLQSSIFLLVLSIGLDATMRDATSVLRNPGQLARLVTAMFVVMPVLAVLAAGALDLPPAAEVALVALAVSPVPPLLPRKAIKQGGAINYTIGLLVAASLLALVLVPVILGILARMFHVPIGVSFGFLASKMLLGVMLPLAIGIGVRQVAPALADRLAGPISTLANVTLLIALVPILLTARGYADLFRDGTLLAFAGFIVVGFLAGHLLGGPAAEDRKVLALATATRHPGIAIAITQSTFPDLRPNLTGVLVYLLLGAVISAIYMKRTGSAPSGAGVGTSSAGSP